MVFQKCRLSPALFSHTKTQDGRGSGNLHIRVFIRHVSARVNMGMDVISSLGLYKVLTANGGMMNTVSNLFELYRSSVEIFVSRNKNYFPRSVASSELMTLLLMQRVF